MALSYNFNRKIHRIAAWIVFIPFILMLITGLLLQMKPWLPWIQPPVIKGSIQHPQISFDQILQASVSDPVAQVQSWNDIQTIDVRPSNGVARVRTKSNYEISIDLGSGKVLQTAPRRTQLLIQLHEGSYFGKGIRNGFFIPVALLLILMWLSGVILLVYPILNQLKRKVKRGK